MKDQKQRPNTIYRERTVFGNITTAVRLNIQNSAKSKDQINFPKQKLSFICLPKNIGSFQTFFQEFSKNLQKVWWQLQFIDSVLVTIVTIELCHVGDGILLSYASFGSWYLKYLPKSYFPKLGFPSHHYDTKM